MMMNKIKNNMMKFLLTKKKSIYKSNKIVIIVNKIINKIVMIFLMKIKKKF